MTYIYSQVDVDTILRTTNDSSLVDLRRIVTCNFKDDFEFWVVMFSIVSTNCTDCTSVLDLHACSAFWKVFFWRNGYPPYTKLWEFWKAACLRCIINNLKLFWAGCIVYLLFIGRRSQDDLYFYRSYSLFSERLVAQHDTIIIWRKQFMWDG